MIVTWGGARRLSGWATTMSLILTYLVVASSAEFGPFAPVRVSHTMLYVGYVASGLAIGWLSGCLRRGGAALLALVLVPALIYAGAMVVLPAALTRTMLLDVFLFWALQRVFMYALLTGVFGTIGLIGGVVVKELYW